jgi:hypothetical protein
MMLWVALIDDFLEALIDDFLEVQRASSFIHDYDVVHDATDLEDMVLQPLFHSFCSLEGLVLPLSSGSSFDLCELGGKRWGCSTWAAPRCILWSIGHVVAL